MTRPAFTPEQRAAIDDRAGSRLLAANAGSGKTAVMVERFVEAVLHDGVDVGAILALTFTEKAAGELRERVRRRFGELGEHEHARAAESAWIGTIHGFCARVLRAHPFAAGLDPRFTVLDEAAAKRVADEAWDRAVEAWAATEGEPAVDLLAAHGPGLRELVIGAHAELRSRGRRAPALSIPPEKHAPDPAGLVEAQRAAADILAGAAGGVRVQEARAALDACAALLASSGAPRPSELDPAKLGNGAAILADPVCAAYRDAWTAYRQACADHHARPALILIDRVLREFGDAYAQAKAARAAVDFEDLQLAVRDALAGDEMLRRRWAERFELIMIDEFQDTNRLQLDVLELLERDNLFAVGDELQSIYGFRHADVTIFRERREALGEAATRRLRTNFRSRRELLDVLNGAFAPLFGAGFEPLVAGREEEPATAQELRLFDPDTGGAPAGPPVELLITDTRGWDDETVVEALGLAAPDTQPWRRAEARVVARRLREEVDGGRRPGDIVVLVRAAASLRLFEQALEEAGLPTYVVGGRGYWSQEQVRDGLAYLSTLANPLDETALYTVLASPFAGVGADTLMLVARAGREDGRGAWAALMAAFAGGAAGVGGAASWAEDLPLDDRERLSRFVSLLAAERAVAERLPVEVLLERGIAASGYDLAILGRPGGERRLANLRKLMRLAREYERAEGRDLRGFLAHAASQSVAQIQQAREGEAALEGEGLDAVRLMTIHRAKGLEFGVVCVADLGRQGPGGRPRMLIGDDGRVGLRLSALGAPASVPALDYEALWAEREEAELAEERRLFYVAMTRAKDQLVLSGGLDPERLLQPRHGGPPIAWVIEAMLDAPGAALAAAAAAGAAAIGERGAAARAGAAEIVAERTWQGSPARTRLVVITPEDLDRLAPPPPDLTRIAAPGTALPAAPELDPHPHVAQAVLPGAPRRLSYSSLGDYARCGYRFYLQRVLGLPDAAPPPRAQPQQEPPEGLDALTRGTIVHELLEELDFTAPAPPPAPRIHDAAFRHGAELTDIDVADIAGLVAAFAASPLRARLAAATTLRREAPFAFALEPGPDAPLVHGVVDVMAREPDGTVLVVDYKTDRLDGQSPTEVTESGYATQRLVYALAALGDGAPRVEVAHCFLERPDEPATATFGPHDAPALQERLLELAEGVLNARFEVTASPHRGLCATCPGRRALCSHPEEVTLAPAPPASGLSSEPSEPAADRPAGVATPGSVAAGSRR